MIAGWPLMMERLDRLEAIAIPTEVAVEHGHAMTRNIANEVSMMISEWPILVGRLRRLEHLVETLCGHLGIVSHPFPVRSDQAATIAPEPPE